MRFINKFSTANVSNFFVNKIIYNFWFLQSLSTNFLVFIWWNNSKRGSMGGKYQSIRWKDTFGFSILWNLKILWWVFLVQKILLG